MWAAVMFLLIPGCSGGDKKLAGAVVSRDSMAVMQTLGVETLISDSGIIRYKVIAEEWSIFDRMTPSFWAFEKGIYLEQFDRELNPEAVIQADTAYYYDSNKLWELRSNVHIENKKHEKFDTELLFWNEKTKEVYSDERIRIEQADKIIEGKGFKSNQQLTDYVIYETEGIFYIDEEEPVAADSLAQ